MNSPPRILVTGARGQLGWELLRVLAPLGNVIPAVRSAGGVGQVELDLSAPACVAAAVQGLRPDVVVNAAAYTAVDAAESDADTARAVNAESVAEMARACAALDATLVHFSTDYVFDGTAAQAYRETDATAPLGVYGATKLAGEQAALELAPRHLVLRTGWVYGVRGKNFVRTMLRLAAGDTALRVVADQHGTPTWARLLAELTGQLLARGPDWIAEHRGLYHACAADHTTWHALAVHAIGRVHGAERAARVEAIDTAAYPTPAARPGWSVMDPGLLQRRCGLRLPGWQTQLDLMLDDLLAGRADAP